MLARVVTVGEVSSQCSHCYRREVSIIRNFVFTVLYIYIDLLDPVDLGHTDSAHKSLYSPDQLAKPGRFWPAMKTYVTVRPAIGIF